MVDLDDIELTDELEEQSPLAPPPRHGDGGGLAWTIASVVVLILLAAGALWVFRSPEPEPTPTPSAATAVAPTATPTPSPTPEPTPEIPLPTLEESDDFVRGLAKAIARHPKLEDWLQQSHLVRRFVAVVDNVAEGKSPRPHLLFMAPEGRFEVTQRGGTTTVAPQSFERYDLVADVVEAVDPEGFARLYQTLRPLAEAAHAELGHGPGELDQTVQRALAEMLAVPANVSHPALTPFKMGPLTLYRYTDPRLESLTPAQKNLLRMGPRNVARVQARLRAILTALDPVLSGE